MIFIIMYKQLKFPSLFLREGVRRLANGWVSFYWDKIIGDFIGVFVKNVSANLCHQAC